MTEPEPKQLYIVYDKSAAIDTDDADVLDTATSLEEAKEAHELACQLSPGALVFVYDVAEGNNLVNERQVDV